MVSNLTSVSYFFHVKLFLKNSIIIYYKDVGASNLLTSKNACFISIYVVSIQRIISMIKNEFIWLTITLCRIIGFWFFFYQKEEKTLSSR